MTDDMKTDKKSFKNDTSTIPKGKPAKRLVGVSPRNLIRLHPTFSRKSHKKIEWWKSYIIKSNDDSIFHFNLINNKVIIILYVLLELIWQKEYKMGSFFFLWTNIKTWFSFVRRSKRYLAGNYVNARVNNLFILQKYWQY